MAGVYQDTANAGYGGGYGYGGNCNNSILDIAALGLVFGDGIGRRGHDEHGDKCCDKIDMHDHHSDHNHEVDEIHKVQKEVCEAERQIGEGFADAARDTLDTKYALDREILESKYALGGQVAESKYALGGQIAESKFENALQGKDIIREIDLQTCGIKGEISEVKFQQALFAKDAAAQLAKCCCELEKQIAESVCVTKQTAAETQMLIIKTDAKNDLKESERERRALERQLDAVLAKQRDRDGRDEQNVFNNFGTISDSLNKVITALGNTAS